MHNNPANSQKWTVHRSSQGTIQVEVTSNITTPTKPLSAFKHLSEGRHGNHLPV
ncbi:hypothetical protein PGT21_030643 [Puccinia graminis f. sp. tritici]|uniref:Uncharacterized protein n=1 Tax=Puccinia graminis f. sp. tritici TaxID=56615 RepID=A0A5B0QYP2_PUCGR|nr:hypothetical protein PGT21_030643 [Puccinia graminis f. sp. tritici]